jgi:Rap1a immunity proteins
MKSILAATLMALSITSAGAVERFKDSANADRANVDSANGMLPGCKLLLDFSNKRPSLSVSDGVRVGFCSGTIRTLMQLSSLASEYGPTPPCSKMPDNATQGQVIRVIIKFIEARPERMHEPFILLALEAMRNAWPCKQ